MRHTQTHTHTHKQKQTKKTIYFKRAPVASSMN